ncbi:MAG TPA: hypothetical protein VLV86_20015 [Vicinamibacterales bacterium]|nr:hypothetical protein [Vicinamibacterales bacterium]
MARCARNSCARWWPDALQRALTLGLTVDNSWFCSADCAAAETARRLRRSVSVTPAPACAVPPPRLGVLLVYQGAITPAQLTSALRTQRSSGRRIGAELLHHGFCTPELVLKGLAAQAGVSYLTAVRASRVSEVALSADEVRALGVIPIHAVKTTRLLMVACRAPVPTSALAVLKQITGWNTQPYLVGDADFDVLMKAATSDAAALSASHFATARDLDDAERRIAAAVAEERRISLIEAPYGSFTWVRLAGANVVSTVLVPCEQEESCRAATTLH